MPIIMYLVVGDLGSRAAEVLVGYLGCFYNGYLTQLVRKYFNVIIGSAELE